MALPSTLTSGMASKGAQWLPAQGASSPSTLSTRGDGARFGDALNSNSRAQPPGFGLTVPEKLKEALRDLRLRYASQRRNGNGPDLEGVFETSCDGFISFAVNLVPLTLLHLQTSPSSRGLSEHIRSATAIPFTLLGRPRPSFAVWTGKRSTCPFLLSQSKAGPPSRACCQGIFAWRTCQSVPLRDSCLFLPHDSPLLFFIPADVPTAPLRSFRELSRKYYFGLEPPAKDGLPMGLPVSERALDSASHRLL